MAGQPVDTPPPYKEKDRSPAGAEEIWKLLVPIPPQDVEVAVIAENLYTASSPATVSLQWGGGKSGFKPDLYVLAIGVSQYDRNDLVPNLEYAAKDAQDLADAFKVQEGLLYQKVDTKVLPDGQASHDEVLRGLEWLESRPRTRTLLCSSSPDTGSMMTMTFITFSPRTLTLRTL